MSRPALPTTHAAQEQPTLRAQGPRAPRDAMSYVDVSPLTDAFTRSWAIA